MIGEREPKDWVFHEVTQRNEHVFETTGEGKHTCHFDSVKELILQGFQMYSSEPGK